MTEQIKESQLNRSKFGTTTLINARNIQDSHTTSSINTENYRNFILYLNIKSVGTPTDIIFDVEFSNDNSDWYKLDDWWWGDLRYEDTATASGYKDACGYYIQGRYMRLVVTVAGGAVASYFTVTAKVEFFN